ncbi:hypothetical protein E4U53_003945, partial [Claviceps sorghi]
ILTLPCGCQRANVVTTTTTQCATAPGQQACRTGYMYTTTATNCPTGSAVATPAGGPGVGAYGP